MGVKASFTVEGEIEDCTRIDNLYNSLKRESQRLLRDAKIHVKVDYTESVGKLEV